MYVKYIYIYIFFFPLAKLHLLSHLFTGMLYPINNESINCYNDSLFSSTSRFWKSVLDAAFSKFEDIYFFISKFYHHLRGFKRPILVSSVFILIGCFINIFQFLSFIYVSILIYIWIIFISFIYYLITIRALFCD